MLYVAKSNGQFIYIHIHINYIYDWYMWHIYMWITDQYLKYSSLISLAALSLLACFYFLTRTYASDVGLIPQTCLWCSQARWSHLSHSFKYNLLFPNKSHVYILSLTLSYIPGLRGQFDLSTWIPSRHFKLNAPKAELLISHSPADRANSLLLQWFPVTHPSQGMTTPFIELLSPKRWSHHMIHSANNYWMARIFQALL